MAPPSVIDLTPDFFAFWDDAAAREPEAQARLWRERYVDPHRNLFARCGGRHGNPEALPAALARFPEAAPRLRANMPGIHAAIAAVEPAVAQLFGLDSVPLRWVLLVGMFWSDGWVVSIDGRPTCFIAVEMLGPSPLAEVVLAHEAAHVAHAACLGDDWDVMATLGQSLFVEGLATLAAAAVVPNLAEAAYLWMGVERTHRGLTPAAWLSLCETAAPALRAALRRELAATDPDRLAPFFLGDRAPANLPERSGYFAGLRLVRRFAEGRSIAELARWRPARAQAAIERALDQSDGLKRI